MIEEICDIIKLEYICKNYPEFEDNIQGFDELMNKTLPVSKRSQWQGKYSWLIPLQNQSFGTGVGEEIVKRYFIEKGYKVRKAKKKGDFWIDKKLIEVKATRFNELHDRGNINQMRKEPEDLYIVAFLPEPQLRKITKTVALKYLRSGNPSESDHFQVTFNAKIYERYFEIVEVVRKINPYFNFLFGE